MTPLKLIACDTLVGLPRKPHAPPAKVNGWHHLLRWPCTRQPGAIM